MNEASHLHLAAAVVAAGPGAPNLIAAADAAAHASAKLAELEEEIATADGHVSRAAGTFRAAKASFATDPTEETHASVTAAKAAFEIVQAKRHSATPNTRQARSQLIVAELDAASALAVDLKRVVELLRDRYQGPALQLTSSGQLVRPLPPGCTVSGDPLPPESELQERCSQAGHAVRLGDLPTVTTNELIEAVRALLSQPHTEAAE